MDADGITTLWDWSLADNFAPIRRPPVPVTFPASPLAQASDLFAAFEAVPAIAGEAADRSAPLYRGLDRHRTGGSLERSEWSGLEPAADTVPAVRRAFDALLQHARNLPDRSAVDELAPID